MLPPFHYRPEADADGFLDKHEWQPQDPCRVLVVEKNDLSSHFFAELPAQWVFHFGNGWEDDAGVIRFDGARAPDPGIMTGAFSEIMRGRSVHSNMTRQYHYRINTRTRTVVEEAMLEPEIYCEFPCIDPRVSCRRYRKLLFLSQNTLEPPVHGMLNEASLFNLETGQRDFFRYPDEMIPEEHLYVPRPGSAAESSGWILGAAFDWRRGIHILHLFNAEALADGPVATAELTYAIPLGLHGKFVAG